MNAKKKTYTAQFWLFVLPCLVLYMVFFLLPLVNGFYFSFTDWNGLSPNIQFVWFENYQKAFSDSRFHHSIIFTFQYTILYVITVNVLGMCAAILLNMKLRTKQVLRTLFFAPYILNVVTIGFIWQFVFGRLFISLGEHFAVPLFQVSMLGDANHVLWAAIIVKLWQSLGYFMVIYTAGLQSVPEELVESAYTEGANNWHCFWRIKLPLMIPSLTVCTFTSLVAGLRVFEMLMTLTGGGPGTASESMALNIYNEAYEKANFGYASAKSIILLVIVAVFTIIQLLYFKKREIEA